MARRYMPGCGMLAYAAGKFCYKNLARVSHSATNL